MKAAVLCSLVLQYSANTHAFVLQQGVGGALFAPWSRTQGVRQASLLSTPWSRGNRMELKVISDAVIATEVIDDASQSVAGSSSGELVLDGTDDLVVYKRFPDEVHEVSSEYEGVFENIDDQEYDGYSYNAVGGRMLRIFVIGGGPKEAALIEKLCNEDQLVCGTYTSWDEDLGLLDMEITKIRYNNLAPVKNSASAKEQIDMAKFLWADVVLVGPSYIGAGRESFLQDLQKELEGHKIGYIGPEEAVKVSEGSLELLKAAVTEAGGVSMEPKT